jgi:hypothetical protein
LSLRCPERKMHVISSNPALAADQHEGRGIGGIGSRRRGTEAQKLMLHPLGERIHFFYFVLSNLLKLSQLNLISITPEDPKLNCPARDFEL